MKEQMAAGGIDVNVIREPADGYWSNVWMQKPFCASYWSGRPTEDWIFSVAYGETAAWNDSSWKHDRFNRLLVQARAELDQNKRREMYVEMQRLVRDDGGVLIPLFANWVMAVSDKLHVPDTVAGNWTMDGQKSAERWWFA